MVTDRNDTFADRVRAFLDGSSQGDDLRRMQERADQDDRDGIDPR